MRKAVPFAAALAVFGAHFAWTVAFPQTAPSGWGTVAAPLGQDVTAYFAGGAFWLGASYALSAAFTAFALLTLKANRRKAAAGAAGGLAVMGTLYAAGCFALGCCGSPMLAVYLGLLGGKAAGLGGPLMFGLTVASVAVGLLWLKRSAHRVCTAPDAVPPACEGASEDDADKPPC